jgi:integral membrane protein
MLSSPVGRLRLLGMIEGLSFLVLLFVAMPIKYIADDPTWVRHVGMTHGLLFIAFCFSLYDAKSSEEWSLRQALVPFVAALVPFGPFLIDRRLRSGEI